MSFLTTDQIKTKVVNALGGELGTYTFTDAVGGQQTFQAILVDRRTFQLTDDGQVWSQEPTVTGLEAVIEPDVASPGYAERLGGDFVNTTQGRITLKQHDVTKTTVFAKGLILLEFKNFFDSPPVRVVRTNKIDVIEQMVFTYTQPTPL